ncbi:glycosyltransferase [Prevotella sp.]|uniref:glycosyltransferase n=1 Tax=Prevotella sp. TaxID=59823 RepID=UPI003458E779
MTKKLLQINITANWGSHGKIAEGIGNVVMSHGWESHVAYGRWANPSSSQLYHIGSMMDERIHGVGSRLFDNHGLMSKRATIQLLHYVEQLNPDIIHLHNIHGYYLNYPELFSFLSQANKPVVWTLHDCWPYTGHCAHYMYVQCDRWKTHCELCPQKLSYPASLLLDCSYRNYDMKKQAFLSVPNLTLVPVSKWLEGDLRQSFLKDCRIQQIYNGIDINVFKPQTDTKVIMEKYNIPSGKRVLLGVASNWWRKGFEDFLQLRRLLDNRYVIVLVGLDEKRMKSLPTGVIGIRRTENVCDLCGLYSLAYVYLNLTLEDNMPTTNLEALACGTPVITYRTGGSPEAIDEFTGYIVNQGDIESVCELVESVCSREKDVFKRVCRQRVIDNFSSSVQYEKYYMLYNRLLGL